VYSSVVGAASRLPLPAALRSRAVTAFARAVGADLTEAEHGQADYGSLGEFFARRLRPGVRPVDPDPAALVSPCDGVVSAIGVCDDGMLLQAKGQSYALADLVVDEELAAGLRGGSYVTIYLSPRDYHRVHTPVAGHLRHYDYVPGTRWPVSPRFTGRVPGLYARNERAVAVLDLPTGGAAAVVLVSAIGVGNLWLTHRQRADGTVGGDSRDLRRGGQAARLDADAVLEAGDEVGAFLLGSTVVVVVPAGRGTFDCAVGEALRCGQRIGGAAGRPA